MLTCLAFNQTLPSLDWKTVLLLVCRHQSSKIQAQHHSSHNVRCVVLRVCFSRCSGSRHSSTERTFADPTRSSERGSGSDKTPTRIGLGEFERGRGRFSSSSGEYRLGVGKGRSGRMPSPFKQCRVRARSVLEHGAPEAKSWRFAELCPQISKTSVVTPG